MKCEHNWRRSPTKKRWYCNGYICSVTTKELIFGLDDKGEIKLVDRTGKIDLSHNGTKEYVMKHARKLYNGTEPTASDDSISTNTSENVKSSQTIH